MSLRNRKNKLNEEQKNKIKEIREALNNNDIHSLRNLSRTEGGFVTTELRKLCWPFLLHVNVSEIRISEKNDYETNIDNENDSNTENEEQIEQSTSSNIPNERKVEVSEVENKDVQSVLDHENEIKG